MRPEDHGYVYCDDTSSVFEMLREAQSKGTSKDLFAGESGVGTVLVRPKGKFVFLLKKTVIADSATQAQARAHVVSDDRQTLGV